MKNVRLGLAIIFLLYVWTSSILFIPYTWYYCVLTVFTASTVAAWLLKKD